MAPEPSWPHWKVMVEAEKEDPEAAKGYTSLQSIISSDELNICRCQTSPAACLVSKVQDSVPSSQQVCPSAAIRLLYRYLLLWTWPVYVNCIRSLSEQRNEKWHMQLRASGMLQTPSLSQAPLRTTPEKKPHKWHPLMLLLGQGPDSRSGSAPC